jgi:glycosyltransferase involved in cell wall biosynthesis
MHTISFPAPRATGVASARVTVDARWLSTGIGTYTLGFMRELKACGPINLRALTMSTHVNKLSFADSIERLDVPIYSLREQIDVPRVTGRGLLHVPHYNIPLAHRGPLLVSILDLTHLLDGTYRRNLKVRLYAEPMLHMAARKAQHIFTLSEYSKRHIVERLHVSPEKVTVTYCGVGAQFRPMDRAVARATIAAAYGVYQPFVLYIGNLKPHKNVSGLLRAFAAHRVLQREAHLLIVGDDRTGRPLHQREARNLGIAESVTFLPRVAAGDLVSLYNAAELVVLPSFEEGFGLPVIEAMACGTPVACSQAASLPEVCGDAALTFDPRDPGQIAYTLVRLLNDNYMRGWLRTRGFEQASRFSWHDCARLHYHAYRRFQPALRATFPISLDTWTSRTSE